MASDSPVSRFLDGIGRWFAPAGESLAPGARIPDLTLPDDSGTPVNLAAATDQQAADALAAIRATNP